MSTFGVLLKQYRQQCRDPESGRPLTQERLAELLSLEADIEGYSGSTVSNWERGLNQIRRDDRHILVALIAVLRQTGGIKNQEMATQLLLAGNYRPLNKVELPKVDAHWHYPQTTQSSSIPSPAEQEALLPPSSYSRLFGVEHLIQHVLSLLQAPHPQLVVLTGIGGIGKTAVADAVARQAIHQNLFAQVLWMAPDTDDVQTDKSFQSVISELCQQLLPEDNPDRSPAKLLTRLRFKLHQSPHLIIVDNLDVSNDPVPTLTQINNFIGKGKCLVTMRHHPPVTVEAAIVNLSELSFRDAVALLQYQASMSGILTFQETSEKEIEELYHVVGGNPLALRLIPRLARMYPLAEILRGWRNEKLGYISDVYRYVYDELWLSLSATEKQVLSVMPLMSQTGGTLDYLQAICGLNRETVWTGLTSLMECCLVEPNGTLYEQRYSMHHLTEQYVLNRGLSQWHNFPFSVEMIQNGLGYWEEYCTLLSDNEWQNVDKEQDNIYCLLQYSLHLPDGTVTPAMQAAWQNLYNNLFRYIEQRGFAAKWLPLLEAITKKYPETSPIHLNLLNRLGELYRLDHQLQQAISLHQHILQLAKQAEDEMEIAKAQLNLGKDYLLGRQYETATAYGLAALNQFNLMNFSERERGATLNLLGLSAIMCRDWGSAIPYLHQAAAIWRDLDSSPELIRTLRNLAWALQAQDDIDGAKACFAEAHHALSKTASVLDHTLIYLAEGTFYFDQKQYPKAEAIFNRIDLSHLKNSGHIYYLAYALNNLGNVAFIQGHFEKAKQLLEESIQYWQHLAEPLEKANSLGRLGDILVVQGQVDEAKEVFTMAEILLEQYDSAGHMIQLREELKGALANIKAVKREG